MLLLKLKEIGLDERLNEDQKYTKFLKLKYFDKDAFENIVVRSASDLGWIFPKKMLPTVLDASVGWWTLFNFSL